MLCRRLQVKLQQSLVDRALAALAQIAVSDKLPVHARQPINRLLQMPVADGILLQERNDGRFMPKDWLRLT
jgi:hypothetical protein